MKNKTIQWCIDFTRDYAPDTDTEEKAEQAEAELSTLQSRLDAAGRLVSKFRQAAQNEHLQKYNNGQSDGFYLAADALETALQQTPPNVEMEEQI